MKQDKPERQTDCEVIIDKINLVTPYNATKELIGELRAILELENLKRDFTDMIDAIDVHEDILAGRRNDETENVCDVISRFEDDLLSADDHIKKARQQLLRATIALEWLERARLNRRFAEPVNLSKQS